MFDPIAQPPDPAPRVLMSYAVNSEFATPKLTRELAVLAQSMLSAFGRVGVVPIVTDAASTPVAAELLDGCYGRCHSWWCGPGLRSLRSALQDRRGVRR